MTIDLPILIDMPHRFYASMIMTIILFAKCIFDVILLKLFRKQKHQKYARYTELAILLQVIAGCMEFVSCFFMFLFSKSDIVICILEVVWALAKIVCAIGLVLTTLLIVKCIAKTWFHSSKIYDFSILACIKKSISGNDNAKLSIFAKYIYIGIPYIAIVYMLFYFGIFESYFGNIAEWNFDLSDVILPFIIITFVHLCILSALVLFIKSKYIKFVSFILSFLAAAMCFQNLFLNGSILLNGDVAYSVEDYILGMLQLTLLMLVCYVLTFVYCTHSINGIKISLFVSISILVMQIVSTVALFIPNDFDFESSNAETYASLGTLSGKRQFDLAKNKNVVVLMFDSFSQSYLDLLLDENDCQDKYSFLNDFIEYEDISSNYCTTPLAMPAILTGQDFSMEKPILDIYSELWHSDLTNQFYDSLHKKNYNVEVYSDSSYMIGTYNDMKGKIDNAVEHNQGYDIDVLSLYFRLLKLSVFKYTSYSVKSSFAVSGVEYINEACKEKETNEYAPSMYMNSDYFKKIKDLQICDDIDNKVSITLLSGMHLPYTCNDNRRCSAVETFDFCMGIVDAYCEKLKNMNKYDDTVIIITADHGEDPTHIGGDPDPKSANTLFLIKPFNYHNSNMIKNVAKGCLPTDLIPTIIDLLDLSIVDTNGYSLISMDESMPRTRVHTILRYNENAESSLKCMSRGISHYNICDVYTYDDIREVDYDDADYSYHIYDFWW